MSDTMDRLRKIISEVAGIPADKIDPETPLGGINEVDSVDLLDAAFELEQEFNITLPLGQWSEEIENGAIPADYFTLKRLAERIDAIVAATERSG